MILALLALLAAAQEAPIVPPIVEAPLTPAYPEEARDRRLHGDVVIRLSLDAHGAVVDAVLLQGVHPLLDEPALAAARQLRFSPATQGGVAVPSAVDYRFHFSYDVVDEQPGATAPGSLYGRVENQDQVPIAHAEITVRPIPPLDAPARKLITGADGRFVAAFLEAGTWEIEITTPAAGSVRFEVAIAAGQALASVFPLPDDDMYEMVVLGERRTWREVARGELVPDTSTVTGSYTLTRRDIEATPGSLEDVARAVQALPGVVGDSDLLAGFHVRGGEMTDVVFLLDRIPLDNPFHLAGFNSVFNPDMISEVRFFAGAAPADVPAGTSAVMSVESWDGAPRTDAHDIDGAIDLSASSARAMVMGPVTKDDELTVALAARRTYLEGYFQVMKWANVIDTAFAAPEYSELSARVAWRPDDRHRLMLTALRSGDSLGLVDSDDESAVSFEGAFELKNALQLYALDYTFRPNDDLEWRTTIGGTLDRSYMRRDLGGVTERTFLTRRGYGRTDLSIGLGEHRLQAGVDGGVTAPSVEGEIEDPRDVPQWANTGLADLGQSSVTLGELPVWPAASGYLQAHVELPVKLRGGVRASYVGATGETLLSPSAGVSVPLPTGTIPKAAWGIYHQAPRHPAVFDDAVGNPDIGSEQAMHLVLGVDQGFPLPGEEAGGLLRLEAYRISLSDLVVHGDDPTAAGPRYANVGTGLSQGLDALVAARTGRVSGLLTYGYLQTERTNPLNTLFPKTIAPPQDQRHTFGAMAELQVSGRWRTTARYSFHTGRPVSQLVAAGEDTASVACLNCERLGPTHNLDLRAEWRRAYDRHRLTVYFEILNALNFRSDFTPIHEVEDGTLTSSMLSHLPARPFLGIRSDF